MCKRCYDRQRREGDERLVSCDRRASDASRVVATIDPGERHALVATRTVRFYRLFGEQGQVIPDLPVGDILDVVRGLPATQAYVQLARMELLGSAYKPGRGAGAKARVPMLVLDRITREVRIRIENNRKYRPLELGRGDTLAEPTHYAFFKDNVVGVMRANGNAPSPASLREYLNTALEMSEDLTIKPLADRNVVRAFSDVGSITKFDVALGPEADPRDFGGDQSLLGGVLRQVRNRAGSVEVELIVKVRAGDPTETPELVLNDLQQAVTGDGAQSITRAKMSYRRLENGMADSFDFLNQAVAHEAEVDIVEGTNGPTDASASEGLAKAYNELYDDIQSSVKDSGGTVSPEP